MQFKTDQKISLQDLVILPAYAQYLLSHKLEPYIREQLSLTRTLLPPLYQFFKDMPEEKLLQLTKQSSIKFLTSISNGQGRELIEENLQNWLENRLPEIDKNDIVAEDITLINYIRKRVLQQFIPDYCRDAEQIVELIREIDILVLESEKASFSTYSKLLKERAEEHSYLLQMATRTMPGAVYIFDIQKGKGVYANGKLPEIIGYQQQELNELGADVRLSLVHPDDRETLKKSDEDLKQAKDGDMISYSYRIQNKAGKYQWLQNYESVFKRDSQGNVIQKIGITLNIDQEHKIAERLKRRDNQLMQAQEIARLGSFYWDFSHVSSSASSKTIEILEIQNENIEGFFQKVHPADKKKVQEAIDQSMRTGEYYCEFRIQGAQEEKIIWSKGIVHYENGKAVGLTGAVMDVTERQRLIQKLQQTEELYKQAEELANMGNWSWDLTTNQLKWTDQLYRIYGLDPQSEKITIERFIKFVHPEDRPTVNQGLDFNAVEKKVDYTFRIISAKGEVKTIRSIAQVYRNADNQPSFVVGTERDITEKQNLIDQLKHSEYLFKQAQALTHVGNWSLDLKTFHLEWSDELYRIHGLKPQVALITFDRSISFIHPEDLTNVKKLIDASIANGQPWQITYRIIDTNGAVKIISGTGEVITDENGSPSTMIGTAQDITEKQTLINQLQESEKLSKQAKSLAKLAAWSLDLKTHEFTWSDEMYDIYEVPKGQIHFNTKEWEDLIHPEDRKRVVDHFNDVIQHKTPYEIVHRLILPNGKEKIIHRRADIIYDKSGDVAKLTGTTQDVTEFYKIQQELRENQTFIQKITDSTPSIISSYNVNSGKYVFISEGLEKLLGYNRSEIMAEGVNFFIKIVHPDDLQSLVEKNAKILEEANNDTTKNDIVAEFTYRMRHKNGNYRWFHTYGTIFDRNSDGKVEHVLNISLDVTEQVNASEKIKEQEHFIQQIADASPTILYLFDVATQSIAYINREIFFVLGYLPEAILELGDTVTENLYHPDDWKLLPGRKQSGRSFQQIDSMIQYECRLKNKDQEWKWFLVREIVFKADEKGEIRQILGAALDINRRKEMEKTILQNTMMLEQSNASLEEFAYVASHDLKEPLRKISTFGDRLAANLADSMTPESKIYLNKIVDASQRMQTMINDLLSISMISGNKSFETVSLSSLLEDALQTMEIKIDQLNAHIIYDQLPSAHVVPSQFRQLFQNLLSNSLKFVKPNVQPEIHIKHEILSPGDVVSYQLAKAPSYIRIEFSDNGIGFENEFAGKIFAIFQRLHGRSEYEGSGIGLAICKKIVEHHGGVIFANGKPGEGAVFTIIIPG